jgi:hypothetical protein
VDELVTGMIAMMYQDDPVRRRPDIALAKAKLQEIRDSLLNEKAFDTRTFGNMY